jgi:hypothetical protein
MVDKHYFGSTKDPSHSIAPLVKFRIELGSYQQDTRIAIANQ